MKVLIAGEPTATMQVGLDTGVILAAEMLGRGMEVDYVDLERVDWKLDTKQYFSSLPIQKIVQVFPEKKEPFDLSKPSRRNVVTYDVIWQRLDPPVNERYVGHMRQFATLSESVLQINNPNWTWRLSEHLLPQQYPEFAVPTWECDSEEKLIQKVQQSPNEVVVKPLHLYSGIGIEFFSAKTPLVQLKQYWQKWQPKVAVQPYLNEITSQGDLRILMMNKKMIGSVLRKPKPGSRLANLHQGGSAHFFEPTQKQLQACEVVAKDLLDKGLYLLGLDFIGDFLTEVNITCPSALPQINQVMGISGEKQVIDEMVKLLNR